MIEFTDYVQPNVALASGDLDANSYQHQPIWTMQGCDRGYRLVSIAKTVIFPIGIYSKKIKSRWPNEGWRPHCAAERSHQWRPRAVAAARANGLIQARPEAGLKACPSTCIENPKTALHRTGRRLAAFASWTTPTPRP